MSTPEKKIFSPAFKRALTPGKSPKRFLYSPSWKTRRFKVKNPKIKTNVLIQSQSAQFEKRREAEKENEYVSASSQPQPSAGFSKVSVKRKNPFSCFAVSKRRHFDETYQPVSVHVESGVPDEESVQTECNVGSTSPSLFDDESPKPKRLSTSLSESAEHLNVSTPTFLSQQFSSSASAINSANSTPAVTNSFTVLPRHLSLRSKVKIICEKPLLHLKNTKHVFEPCMDLAMSLDERDLSDNCGYWMHPFIPWLKLFPRYTSNTQSTSANTQSTSFLSQQIKSDICSAWNVSFQSAYDLLRNGNLEMFYLCSSNMTMCFESKENLGSRNRVINVHIVPTSNGFRDTLVKQNIKFSRPYLDSVFTTQLSKCTTSSNANISRQNEGEDLDIGNNLDCSRDDFLQDQASCQDWLHNLGAERVQVSSQKSTQSFENEHKYDYTKQSSIVIHSESVHQFFNFLLNFKSLIPSSGSLAGLPPTILSTKPFSGATLQQLSLKVRSYKKTCSKIDNVASHRNNEHSFEIYNGPILPGVFNTLMYKIQHLMGSETKFESYSSFAENSDAFDKDHNVSSCIEHSNGSFHIFADN